MCAATSRAKFVSKSRMLQNMDDDYLRYLFFSNEAKFVVSGYADKHSYHVWGSGNGW
jgi:hypothetical protein